VTEESDQIKQITLALAESNSKLLEHEAKRAAIIKELNEGVGELGSTADDFVESANRRLKIEDEGIKQQERNIESLEKFSSSVSATEESVKKVGVFSSAMTKSIDKTNTQIDRLGEYSGSTGAVMDSIGNKYGPDVQKSIARTTVGMGLLAAQVHNAATGMFDLAVTVPGLYSNANGLSGALLDTAGMVFNSGMSMQELSGVMKENKTLWRSHGKAIAGSMRENESFRIGMGLSREEMAGFATATAGWTETNDPTVLAAETKKYVVNLRTLALQTGRNASEMEESRKAEVASMTGFIGGLDAGQAKVFDRMVFQANELSSGMKESFLDIFKGENLGDRQAKAMDTMNSLIGMAAQSGRSISDIAPQLQKDLLAAANGDIEASVRAEKAMKVIQDRMVGAVFKNTGVISEGTQRMKKGIVEIDRIRDKSGRTILEVAAAEVKAQKEQAALAETTQGQLLGAANMFKSAIGNFGGGISSTLLAVAALKPALGTVKDSFMGVASGFKKSIMGVTSILYKSVAGVAKAFISVGSAIMSAMWSIIKFTAQMLWSGATMVASTVKNAIMGSAALLPALLALAAAAWAVVVPFLPLIAVVTAIVGIGYLLYKNWDAIVQVAGELWQSFRDFLDGAGLGAISEYIEAFGNVIGGIIDFIHGLFTLDGDMMSKATATIWGGLKGMFDTLFGGIMPLIGSLGVWVMDKFKGLIDSMFGEGSFTGLSTIIQDWLIDPIVKFFASIFDFKLPSIGDLLDLIPGFGSIGDGIKNLFGYGSKETTEPTQTKESTNSQDKPTTPTRMERQTQKTRDNPPIISTRGPKVTELIPIPGMKSTSGTVATPGATPLAAQSVSPAVSGGPVAVAGPDETSNILSEINRGVQALNVTNQMNLRLQDDINKNIQKGQKANRRA